MSGIDPRLAEAVGNSLRGSYFERIDDLVPLQAENWHGDRLFRFASGGRSCLARLIVQPRVYRTSPRIEYDDALLDFQLSTCVDFARHGLPYMRLVPPSAGGRLRVDVSIEECDGRLVVFEWAAGDSIGRVDAGQATQIGHWLGRSHAAFEKDTHPPAVVPCSHDVELHARWSADVESLVADETAPGRILQRHLDACAHRVEMLRSGLKRPRIVVHGDFNLPNVLWTDSGRKLGTVVDFDQIGLSRAIEDLAWVVKWYGLRSASSDPLEPLVALIAGYAAQRPIHADEWSCLPALLWLSGGMNYNFVLKVSRALGLPRTERDEQLGILERDYRQRSERLEILGSLLVQRCGSSVGMRVHAPSHDS